MRKLLVLALAMFAPVMALADDGSATSYMKLGYFLAMGIAAASGVYSQSRAASEALQGIARNPSAADKIQTPMLLSFAFMESLVIFTLISVFFA